MPNWRFEAYTTTGLVEYMRLQERDAQHDIGVKRAERELRWAWHELDARLSRGDELPGQWRGAGS